MNRKILSLAAAAILLSCGLLLWVAVNNDDDDGYPTYKDVRYGPHERDLMDIYLPDTGTGPVTMFMYIHGGGWMSGDKSAGRGWAHLADSGYAVVSINYRFVTPGDSSTTCGDILNDIHDAIAYIKDNAGTYGINVSGMAIGGYSAGGHLALLYSYSMNSPIPIKLAVAESAPTDFTDPEMYRELQNGIGYFGSPVLAVADLVNTLAGSNYSLADLRNESMNKPELNAISPEYYAAYSNARVPYTIIKHGDSDNVVPVSQGHRLADKMLSEGLAHTLIIFANSFHGQWNDPVSDEIFMQNVLDRMALVNI